MNLVGRAAPRVPGVKAAQSSAWHHRGLGRLCPPGSASTVIRRILIALTIIVLIAASALIGVLVANGPEWLHSLRGVG